MSACWIVAVLFGLVASPVRAHELFRSSHLSLDFSGSVRELVSFGQGTDRDRFEQALVATLPSPVCLSAARFADCPAFAVLNERDVWKSLTRVRSRFDLHVGDRVSAALAYDHQLEFGILRTLEEGLGQSSARDGLFDLEDEIHVLGMRDDSKHARWTHRLYRAYVRAEGQHAELVLGRQRIPWGVARLWNPIDRFNAIPPLAIEPDESLGVDAIDLKWRFTDFSFLEAAWAPGQRSEESAAALRWHGVWQDADFSLMAGIFDRARTLGFDLARNVGAGVIRLEAVVSNPQRSVWPVGARAPRELGSFWQVVASYDRRLPLGSGLYVLVEHLYNGNALGFGRGLAGPELAFFESTALPPDPALASAAGPFVQPVGLARFGGSRVVSLSRHQTGFQLAYEPMASLSLEGLAIVDWNGGSAAIFPTVRYSGLSSAELTVGAQVFVGPRRSAFGSFEPVAYLLVDFFF